MTRAEWRKEVQIALIRRNERISSLARDMGVSPQWIYQVLNGSYDGNAATQWERLIAKQLGMEPPEGFTDEN